MSKENKIENKSSANPNKVKKSGGGLGAIFGLVVIGGIVYAVATSEPEVSPYDTTQYDEVVGVTDIASNIEKDKTSEGSFIRTLPDGLHIIHDKSADEYYLVMKAQDSFSSKAYGFFGMDEISHQYVPDVAPQSDTDGFTLWSIAKATDILEHEMRAGKYNYTISGDVLNGTDLSFSVIYDDDYGVDKGYGYMGLSVKASAGNTYSNVPSFN